MKVASKEEMYVLYHAGEFGNKLRTWNSLDEIDYDGLLVVRYRAPASPWYCHGVDLVGARSQVRKWVREGADPARFVFNEVAPDAHLSLQGEVQRSERYLDVTCSDLPLPMRQALQQKPVHLTGVQAVLVLKLVMDPPSWDNIQRLFCLYPDSVVEWSSYRCSVGELGWNTLFWEVRNY